MKKFILHSLSVILCSMVMLSCGSKKEEQESRAPRERAPERTLAIAAEDVTLEGDAGSYLKINQDSIKFYGRQEEGDLWPEVFFEVEMVLDQPIKDFYDFGTTQAFNVTVYDEVGREVKTFTPSYEDRKNLEKAVQSGDKTPVKLRYKNSVTDLKDYNKFFDQSKKMTIEKIDLRTNAEYHSSGSSSSDEGSSYYNDDESSDDDDDDTEEVSSSSSSSSSSEWDEILDQYESYVDEMVSLYKKIQAGDQSALIDYTEALKDAQSLSNKLAKAKGSMTAAQVRRYTQILNKYSKALR